MGLRDQKYISQDSWYAHCDIYWSVVWNMAFIFPYIGNVIIPTDFHILQRGSNHQPVYICTYMHYLRFCNTFVFFPAWQVFGIWKNGVRFDVALADLLFERSTQIKVWLLTINPKKCIYRHLPQKRKGTLYQNRTIDYKLQVVLSCFSILGIII